MVLLMLLQHISSAVLTKRIKVTDPWWDIVYEWENVMADSLKLHFDAPELCRYRSAAMADSLAFMFQMRATQWGEYNRANIAPCIIDFYLRGSEQLDQFYREFSNNPFVFVSSREVYEYLEASGCPLNIKHLALSLPDKYAITEATRFEKTIDLITLGRPSRKMITWLEQYAASHPDFIYANRLWIKKSTNGEHYTKYVTNKGKVLGYGDTRKENFDLMRSAKVSLYSTPGVDGDRPESNGYDQVTPRFLEMLASGCHIIARYSKNADTDWFDMPSVCPTTETYEQFEAALDYARTHEVDMGKCAQYLSRHYTSCRAKELEAIVAGA